MAARVASEPVARPLAVAAAAPRTSLWQETGRRFRRHRLAMVGSVILLALVLSVLLGPLVWRLPINDIDFKAKLKGPSWSHPLGTDDLGQDLLARMLYGGRISLAVGIAAMLIASSIGTAIGAFSGFMGGVVDHTLMRIADMFLALPGLPLLLLIVYLFRDSLRKVFGPEVGIFILIVAVIVKHVVRNALIPVVTLVALQLPAVFGGAIVTEQIFRVPGIGSLLISAILANDTPVIMAVTFVFSCLVILFNLVADILYGWLDPRISLR